MDQSLVNVCQYINDNCSFDKVVNMINNKANVNCQDDRGLNCLMKLAGNFDNYHNYQLINILIDAGINLDIQDNNGYTILMFARDNSKLVQLLIDKGANLNITDRYGWTALMKLSRLPPTSKNFKTIKLLIDSSSDINVQDSHGWNVLMILCELSDLHYNYDRIKLLSNHIPNLNLQNESGKTALMMVCNHCNLDRNHDVVDLLLDMGADPDVQNNIGYTALMYIIQCIPSKNIKNILAKLIILSNKSINFRNNKNETAYDIYIKLDLNIIDDYELKLLRGEIYINNTKSARSNVL